MDLSILSVSFSKFIDPMYIFKSIYNGDISLEDVELKKDIGRIKQGNPKDK